MTPTLAADLFHSALWLAVELGAPILGCVTAAAVVIGVLQAATQVQDSSISFAPKLAAALLVTWLWAGQAARLLSGFVDKTLGAIPWIVRQ
ncbi:MAG: flagellar biosynthetic protein FliQ [Deltaproteobacteria bacterium]|jgi:flagellar biosynthetic protein FliQ|nr:flagellar biosynthetic protein FliQ [Deltaproteobacteria bacterium]